MAGQSGTGVPRDAELLAFATAANGAGGELCSARNALEALVGAEGLIEAAATVAIFNGLVRAADGTGIELDARVFEASADFRARLGVDQYAGAANSLHDVDGTLTNAEG